MLRIARPARSVLLKLSMSLFDTIGTYDNLDEPTPFFNNKSVIYGFIITFLVSKTRKKKRLPRSLEDVYP